MAMISPPSSEISGGNLLPCNKCGHPISSHKSPKRDRDGNLTAECTLCNESCAMSRD